MRLGLALSVLLEQQADADCRSLEVTGANCHSLEAAGFEAEEKEEVVVVADANYR
jgi:hypothetical protein